MPSFLLPRRSGAHRVAAIALYRALLSKCRTVPFPAEVRATLENVVRGKFKANAHQASPKLLKDAFAAGYQGVCHLDASAAGDEASTSFMQSLLSRLPRALKAPPVAPVSPSRSRNPTTAVCLPMVHGWNETALAQRPRPLSALKGRNRRVPVLVSANRIPFLRFTKPQPQALSMYIKTRVVQRQRRHDRRKELEAAVELGHWEDEWDRDVRVRMEGRSEGDVGRGRSSDGDAGATWQDVPLGGLKEIHGALDRETEKNKLWAQKMVAIVDREKKMAETERKQRRMAKNSQRRERKAKREAAAAAAAAANAGSETLQPSSNITDLSC